MSEAKSGAIFEGADPGCRFDHPRYETRRMVGELPISPGQETKMPIWTKFALSVAIVLGTAATASAATKSRKIAGSHRQWQPRLQSKNPLLTTLAINPARTIQPVNRCVGWAKRSVPTISVRAILGDVCVGNGEGAVVHPTLID
jgi:hypothetical protein